MTRVLILDDQVLTAEALSARMASELRAEPTVLHRVADLRPGLLRDGAFDVAIIDLSFRDETMHGLDALFALHRHSPATRLVIHTVGDTNVESMLRDAWEVLPIAGVVAKGPSAAGVVSTVAQVLSTGQAPIDPVLQPLLPSRRVERSPSIFGRLVPHRGHAKMWRALAEEPEGAPYAALADAAEVKVNAIKNYRADVLGELRLHHLDNPTTRQMQEFARRSRPFLRPFLAAHDVRVIGID